MHESHFERDFLELHFAEGGRIWVPVEQIERVSRYAGGENVGPRGRAELPPVR